MKIRFTCSFFGCLHGHLHGFVEPDPARPAHKVVYPVEIGFPAGGENWSLEFLHALPPEGFRRLAARAVESIGTAETLDLLIGLPDPLYPRRHPLGADIAHLAERLTNAFSGHGPLDFQFVMPRGEWLGRLSSYHLLKSGPAGFPPDSDDGPVRSVIDEIQRLGFTCIEAAPEEVIGLLVGRFPGLVAPVLPGTLEGFATHVRDPALLVTSAPAIFAAWRDIHASPLISQLPEDWDIHLGKYWHLLEYVMCHFTPDSGAAR